MNLLNRPQQNPAHREKLREVKRWVEELLGLSAEARRPTAPCSM
jgi:hypothetical protein